MDNYNEIIEKIRKENEDVEAIKKYANKPHNVMFYIYSVFIVDYSYHVDNMKKYIMHLNDDNNHVWDDGDEKLLNHMLKNSGMEQPEKFINSGKYILITRSLYTKDGRGEQDDNIEKRIEKLRVGEDGDYLYSYILNKDGVDSVLIDDEEADKGIEEINKIAKYFE